ncbi:hypothetical protein [Pedobacter sp. Leaf216]|nr:hypothetical protein [Pedobacter sp. Leaf216]
MEVSKIDAETSLTEWYLGYHLPETFKKRYGKRIRRMQIRRTVSRWK